MKCDVFQSYASEGEECFFAPLFGRYSAIKQRQFDVFDRGGFAQQVESLKNKSDVMTPKECPLITAELTHINPFEEV